MSEITKVEAFEIKQMSGAGMHQAEIAYAIGCSERTVRNVLADRHTQRDDRANAHDRMLGPISSGCFEADEEIPIFEDPTCDAAEEAELLEKNSTLKLLNIKEI